jgi:hypothetical protein
MADLLGMKLVELKDLVECVEFVSHGVYLAAIGHYPHFVIY